MSIGLEKADSKNAPRTSFRARGGDRWNERIRHAGLVDHVDRFLGDGVEGGHRLGVCLERTLSDDQVGELGRAKLEMC